MSEALVTTCNVEGRLRVALPPAVTALYQKLRNVDRTCTGVFSLR